jgi:hypothetical protein
LATGGDSESTQGGADGGGGGTGACEPAQILFVVSRSGAMFSGVPAPWDPIREASLAALKKVDALAELGFLAVTGEAPNACPTLEEVAPAPSSYRPIETLYGALASPVKGESPFMYGLDRAAELLTGAGKKYIVFVLNGEADYCSDGLPACPTDSVIARIQKLEEAGISTFIAAAPAPLAIGEERIAAYETALQGYANAGAGLPTESHDDPMLVNQMCSTTPDSGAVAWRDELEASGKPATATLADYSETGGDAAYVSLDPSDISGMTNALSTLLESIATCE